jgi:hypothetical protein
MDLVEKLAITLYGDIGPNEWDEVDEDSKDMCRFNVRRLLSCIEEEGMVVVPKEPTHDMLVMMWKAHGEEDPNDTAAQFRKAYKTALATAPSPSSASA